MARKIEKVVIDWNVRQDEQGAEQRIYPYNPDRPFERGASYSTTYLLGKIILECEQGTTGFAESCVVLTIQDAEATMSPRRN